MRGLWERMRESLLTQKPDLVIGQPAGDFFRSIVNYPNGDPDLPTQTGLLRPIGLAVDDRRQFVGGRFRQWAGSPFPRAFQSRRGNLQTADLVLGQSDFTHKDQSASAQTMNTPYGLAFFSVAIPRRMCLRKRTWQFPIPVLNRVLVFQQPFVNGESAFTVVGQPSFASGTASGNLTGLNSPRHVATDTSGRLYVADSGNNRVLVFRRHLKRCSDRSCRALQFPDFQSEPRGSR